MSDDQEIGRPNYSASAASSSYARSSPTPTGDDFAPRLERRAIAAMAAAVFAWSSWTSFYHLPIAAALVAAVLAARWGNQAMKRIAASNGARSGAFLAEAARALGLADLAVLGYLIFHYYFIAHSGADGVLKLLLT